MNRDHVVAFINAINQAQPYVPPVLFINIINNPIVGTLMAIASGVIEMQARPPATTTEALPKTELPNPVETRRL